MQFNNPRYKLVFIMVFAIVIFAFAFLGLIYIQRLKNALIFSTKDYKTAIIALEAKVAAVEEQELRLQKEIDELRNKIVAQGVHVTNDISLNYKFEVDPSNLSLNHTLVEKDDNADTVRIIVAGHPYGNPNNLGAMTPSETLVNSISDINVLYPDLVFTLGDLAYLMSEKSFQELHINFLDKINAPVFNAPGNHDFNNGREFYESKFGQTFYYFKYAKTQMVVLDTEIANCFIVGNQKEMLKEAVSTALDDDEISNILVFFHKVLFLDDGLLLRASVNGGCKYGTNYVDIRNELLLPAAQLKPIYLVAGDVGAFGGNLSPFYNKYPDVDLYTLAIGLGDSPDDVLLQIDIILSEVEFQLIPIGGNQFSSIETYTPEYWAAP